MEVVYGLFNNMKVVMDSKETFAWRFLHGVLNDRPFRWEGINRQYPRGPWYDRFRYT